LQSSCTTSPFPSITLGDGSTPIYCVGQTQIPSHTKPLLLRDVLVVMALIKNLISLRQFTRDNLVSIEFDIFGLSVKDYLTRLRSHTSIAPVIYTLFMVFLSPRLPLPWWLWWICGIVDSSIPIMLFYHLFELLHCDLWTSPISSASSFKYYLVILDDFMHFVWTFPLRNKSDVHIIFLNFQRYVPVHLFLLIHFIQCDNGREFDNIKNRTFFLQHGILLHFSCPYTLPQNGKAERFASHFK
jgi:hypothetical protein